MVTKLQFSDSKSVVYFFQIGYIGFMMVFTYVVLIKMESKPSWQEVYIIAYIFTFGMEKVREVSLVGYT